MPAMWETWVQSLGWEVSPGEGNGYPLQRLSCRDQEGRRGSEEAVPGPSVGLSEDQQMPVSLCAQMYLPVSDGEKRSGSRSLH